MITTVVYIKNSYYTYTRLALFHGLILTSIMCLSELFVSLLFYSRTSDIFHQSFSQTNPDFVVLLAILSCFSKTLYFTNSYILSHVLQSHYRKQKMKFQISIELLLIPLLIFVVLATLLHVRRTFCLDANTRAFICISALSLFIIIVLTYHICDSIQRKNEEIFISKIAVQKEMYVTSYYKSVAKQKENQQLLVHDIRKHLMAVSILNKQHDFQKIDNYIGNLLKFDIPAQKYLCDSSLLSAILCAYSDQCSKEGISFHSDVHNRSFDFMSDVDLVPLFCNILDNALESCRQISNSFIELFSEDKTDDLLIICLQNSAYNLTVNKNEMSSPFKHTHGYGLKSVNCIAHKYGGHMDYYFSDEDSTFHTIISLCPRKLT